MNLTILLAAILSLNGTWQLEYFPQPDDGAVRTLPLPADIEPKTVKATVPGNCELDLVHAGLLPSPEIGMNVLKLQDYEGHQWLYTKTFVKPSMAAGERAILRFDGIDTLGDVFLNGQKVGEAANMLIPHEYDVTKHLKDGENVVQVLLRSIRCEAQYETVGELGHSVGGSGADGEPFRKAAHMGGWDIFPRVLASGLWRDVLIEVRKPVRIDQPAWIVCDLGKDWANLLVQCRVQAPFRYLNHADLRYTVSRNGKVLSERREIFDRYQNCQSFGRIGGIERWWPKGMGDQPLYDAKIEVVDRSGTVLAESVQRIGFRTIRLERDDVYSDDRPGQFLFRVNGEPCYVRGSNWVPLDSFHSRDRQFLRSTLEMFDDLNCNLVRVWGGGVYETDEFFDFCDEHGIMVWQDFMTGCSVFPQNDAYAKATENEIRSVVLRLRNRASLALWSGNNENDEAFRWKLGGKLSKTRDPNHERNSRRTIPDVLYEYDVTRDYLPSSPYISSDVFAGRAKASEQHLWGAREAYKVPYYTNSPAWFASEMGYHGCPNLESLRRMMTKEALYPWKKIVGTNPKTDYLWNDEWLLKASDPRVGSFGQRRNSLMTNQIKLMFGAVDTNLEVFVEQSQFVQSEAMKTFCELFRSRKFTRFNGLVWWNVRDGWPQISDAVVDYWGGKKSAYYTLKNAQLNQIVCLVDDHTAWAVNDERRPVKGLATFTDAATGKKLLEKSDFVIPANGKVALGIVPFAGQGVVKIEAMLDGKPFHNHFLYGQAPFDWKLVKQWMR